jgi:homoserine trans-succinylase
MNRALWLHHALSANASTLNEKLTGVFRTSMISPALIFLEGFTATLPIITRPFYNFGSGSYVS